MLTIWRVSGYKFDVFISYCRYGSVRKWLENHFYQKFRECLADQVAPAPKVYVDWTMPRGVHWPSNLRNALLHSKIMVPLLAPPYFESKWCMVEWESMRERERLLGLGTLERPQGLVYPILYADSDNFPDEAKGIARWDFKKLGMPEPVFQGSQRFVDFHWKVSELAEDLVALLKQVPDWQPDWPIIDPPDPPLMPPPSIPRFGP
jgi:hypothetical protein